MPTTQGPDIEKSPGIENSYEILLAWLQLAETQGKLIDSQELYWAHQVILQEIEKGREVPLDLLRRLQTIYPQGLLNGRPEDPSTLSSVLGYVGMRLPANIFEAKLNTIGVTNDALAVMAVPHVSNTQPTDQKRDKTAARARWILKQRREDGSIDLTFQLRDSHPGKNTDGIELFSWLGSLEQIRTYVQKYIAEHGEATVEQLTPIIDTFRSIYIRQMQSKQDALKRKVRANNLTGIELTEIHLRIYRLAQKIERAHSETIDYFLQWINRPDINIAVTDPEHFSFKIDRTGELEHTAAHLAAQLVAENLGEWQLPTPTDILFGNDFSLRLFLSVGLFSDTEFKYMREAVTLYLAKKKLSKQDIPAEQYQIELKRELGEFNDYLDTLDEGEWKFFLVQQTSVIFIQDGDFPEGLQQQMVNFQDRMFSIDTISQLGIIRVVTTENSSLADPIDLICPYLIDREILARLPQSIRAMLESIIANKQTILSVPYTLGHLTATTAQAFVKKFETLKSIGFIGKIGNAVGAKRISEVGELVQILSVSNQLGQPTYDVPHVFDGEYPFVIHHAHMFTTFALTFQSHEEMRALLEDMQEGQILTMDCEAYYLMEWFYALDESMQQQMALTLLYYISDQTVLPEFYDPETDDQRKISHGMGYRGSVSLYRSLRLVLGRLAQKNLDVLAEPATEDTHHIDAV